MNYLPVTISRTAISSFLLFFSVSVSALDFDEYFIDPDDGMLDASRYLSEVPMGFLPMPTVITEPAVGTGLGLVGIFFHESAEQKEQRLETIAKTRQAILPSNVSALGLMGTNNGTKGAMAAHMGFWQRDRIRYRGALILPSANLDFYSVGQLALPGGVEFNLKGPIIFQELKARPTAGSPFFIGVRQTYRKVDMSLDNSENLRPFADEALNDRLQDFIAENVNQKISTSALGVLAEFDNRNNPFNPETGYLLSARYDWFNDAIGSDYDFGAINLTSLNYWTFADEFLLGMRFQYDSVNRAGHEAGLPQYTLPFIDLRGVPKVRYQNNRVLVAEAELGWKPAMRWKLSVFSGAGRVAEHFSGLDEAETINTIGAGFRYMVARRYGFSMGLDLAHSDEDSAVYIQAGSAW